MCIGTRRGRAGTRSPRRAESGPEVRRAESGPEVRRAEAALTLLAVAGR
ncbi:MAG TPA: hypothetical protein VFP55_09475 [Solirubrobacteraceae bacterium]|nr:hypothetical protein [Solirubrobacteraceae bacterium]